MWLQNHNTKPHLVHYNRMAKRLIANCMPTSTDGTGKGASAEAQGTGSKTCAGLLLSLEDLCLLEQGGSPLSGRTWARGLLWDGKRWECWPQLSPHLTLPTGLKP